VIGLLLDHGADPNMRDTGYDATPAGWAEHHGQREAQELLEALEQPDARTGAAMRTVTAAFTAVSEGRFDDLATMLASEIDWRGLADEDGHIPRCHGRAQALDRMRIGLLVGGEVSISAFIEEGERVLAHVRSLRDDRPKQPERFVVAEVHEGQITRMHAYATEEEARVALQDGFLR
jgi:ketosteroid isomerase-like protein